MNGSSWYLAIGMKASFSLSYTVLQGNLGIFKPRVPLELVLGVPCGRLSFRAVD